MMPPETAGRIVGYYKNEYIGLPYSKNDIEVGKKIILDQDNADDILFNDGCLWQTTKGEIEITKVYNNAAEGKFFFTTVCNSKNKTIDVKDGFFKILFTKKS